VCPSIDNIAEQWSNWDGDQVDIEVSDFEKPRTSILKFQHSALPKILIKLKFSCQRTSFFFCEKGRYIKHKYEHSTSSQLQTGPQRKREIQLSPSSSSPVSSSLPPPLQRAKSTSPPGKGLQALELPHAPSPGTPSESISMNGPSPCRKERGRKDPPSPAGRPATGARVHRRRPFVFIETHFFPL